MKLLNMNMQSGRREFVEKGYRVPSYDREELKKKTHEEPTWLHFGPGNIFRAYQAEILEKALEKGYDRGVIVAEGWDFEILDKAYRPYDNLSLSVVLHADGQIEKNIIGCVTESLKADRTFSEDWARLCEIFRKPSLQLVSFSITEKGYLYTEEDLKAGRGAKLMMGKLTALLYERFLAGEYPLTLQSMDNCSHNGDYVRRAVEAYAKAWTLQGLVPEAFSAYVKNREKISCPWCMIDKITPRPSENVQKMLEAEGFSDAGIIETEKHSYTAAFVNAEDVGYLVIEDNYTNGRLPLEDGGAIFTDRDTVDAVERMKVGTCLNPLHTALGLFSVPLGITYVQDSMKDPDLYRLITRMLDEESMPVVTDPKIMSPRAFADECIESRFVNPFMPDTNARLNTDVSQAIRMRYSGTVREYLKKDGNADGLKFIPLIYASYARYLAGVDDDLNPYALSPDPVSAELSKALSGLKAGAPDNDYSCLRQVFSRTDVFDFDLYEIGLGEKCEAMARELFAGKGAVRETLHRYVTG